MTVAGAHESIAGLDMRIHVGFHRTGSTFLQQAVYPHLGKYLNIATQNTNGPLGYLARYFNFPRELGNAPYEKGYVDSSTTDAKGASLQQQLEAYFGAGPERAGKPFLLSNEDIVGPAFYCDHFGMPEQIARVFPRAKILLCIRSQFTIIPSIFNHNFSKVGTALYQRFVEALIKNEKLHYYTVTQRYREVFGIDAVPWCCSRSYKQRRRNL